MPLQVIKHIGRRVLMFLAFAVGLTHMAAASTKRFSQSLVPTL